MTNLKNHINKNVLLVITRLKCKSYARLKSVGKKRLNSKKGRYKCKNVEKLLKKKKMHPGA
jgi:hypothetical protein